MALRARHNVLLSLCLSLAIAFASGQQVLLHDASQQYLQRSGTVDVGPWGVAAAACSACKLAAPKKAASGSTAADQAKDIVTSDAFRAPRALVVLNVVGAEGTSLAEKLSPAFEGGHTLRGSAGAAAVGAQDWVQLGNDLAAANPDVRMTTLDHSALKCDAACLLGQLPLVAQQLGGTLHLSGKAAARKGLQGATLHLPGGGALDMSRPAHRLLGIELAAFSKALEQQLTAAKAAPQQDLAVLESTFVGLQALGGEAGADPALVAAAGEALATLLGRAKGQLDEALGRDVVYQVTVLGDAPVPSSDPMELMTWKETSRRVLLSAARGGRQMAAAASPLAQDADAQSKSFTRKAAAYAGFFIVLYFSAGAIYCLTNMEFKQDTLLYGRTKTD